MMDELYDPAEIYSDDDDFESKKRKIDDCSDIDDDQNDSKSIHPKEENEEDFNSKERFIRTEGCESKRTVLERLSPSLEVENGKESSGEHHVHKNCIFRLVIFNIPQHVTEVSAVRNAVQSVLEDDGKVEFVDGVYMKSAVVCITPVSAVDRAAKKLKTIDGLPVITRKMTAKDHKVFMKKKKKVMSERRSTCSERDEKQIPEAERHSENTSTVRITISNVSHNVDEENLTRIFKMKVEGIKRVILHAPPSPNNLKRLHIGKGHVDLFSKADAYKFFEFHGMDIGGRKLVIHRVSTLQRLRNFAPKARVLTAPSRREYRLKISNLSVEISSQELQEIFAGEVNGRVRVKLGRSEEAPHSGSGELIFDTAQLAKMAHELMDGCDLGGSKILLQMDFDESEANQDIESDLSSLQGAPSNPSNDSKDEHDEMISQEKERDQESRQQDLDQGHRKDCEKDSSDSRCHANRSPRNSDRQLSSRHYRNSDGNRTRTRERSQDRTDRRNQDKRDHKSQDRTYDKSRGGTHDRNQDRIRDRSRNRTHDRSRGADQDKAKIRRMDDSKGRSRSAIALELSYRRYRGVHIYTERAVYLRRSFGPELQLQMSNIEENLPEERLIDFVLEKYPGLTMVYYERNRHGAFRGVAILEFKSRVELVAALNLKNTPLYGRNIIVKIDLDKPHPFPGPQSLSRNDGPSCHRRDMNIQRLPRSQSMNQNSPMFGGIPNNGLDPHMSGHHEGRHNGPQMGFDGPQMGIPMIIEPEPPAPLMRGGMPGMGNTRDELENVVTRARRGSFGAPVIPQDEMYGVEFPSPDGPVGGSGDMTLLGAPSEENSAAARQIITHNPDMMGPRNGNSVMRNRGMLQIPTNQMPQKDQRMTPRNVDPSTETYGLPPSFLESLGVSLPIVKEVLVMNVDMAATEDDLKELFGIAGTVVRVQYNRQHGQAIVEMAHPVEAVQSISMLHQQEYFDRIITVRMLRENDPENLVARAVVAAKPRGLKTIGRGLGVGGMPVCALSTAPPNPQPGSSRMTGPISGSRRQTKDLKNLLANTDTINMNSRYRWHANSAKQMKSGQTSSGVLEQNRTQISPGYPTQSHREDGPDFYRQEMSRPDVMNTGRDDRGFRDQELRGSFPSPQDFPSNKSEQNFNFHSPGVTSRSMGRDNRSSNSAKFAENFHSGWNQSGVSTEKGTSHRSLGPSQSDLDFKMNPSSGTGRGPLNASRGRGFGSARSQLSSSNKFDSRQENTSTGKVLILSNLPVHTHESAIKEVCSLYGVVKNIDLYPQRRFCGVTFESPQQASMAADILNNQDFIGSIISATIA